MDRAWLVDDGHQLIKHGYDYMETGEMMYTDQGKANMQEIGQKVLQAGGILLKMGKQKGALTQKEKDELKKQTDLLNGIGKLMLDKGQDHGRIRCAWFLTLSAWPCFTSGPCCVLHCFQCNDDRKDLTNAMKKLLLLVVAVALLAACTCITKETKPVNSAAAAPAADTATAAPKKVHLLFVQTAQSVEIKNNKMILKGVSPNTIFFSDRPDRITGHIATAQAMPKWSQGEDSFAADPPNAVLSVISQNKTHDMVVELRNPVLKGDMLTYDIKVLHGKMIASGGPCTLFIDSIGRPMTPASYAGAARRSYRRGDDGTVVYVDGDNDDMMTTMMMTIINSSM